MKTVAMMNERHVIAEDAFVEMVVWQVAQPVRGSLHRLKYRLALVVAGECILRYDNEAGKGDHRHVGNVETPYEFRSYEQMLTDFWADVDEWRRRR
jgi:uncharacterized protein DUF6516